MLSLLFDFGAETTKKQRMYDQNEILMRAR
jgi:hypothetical protein